MLVNGCKCVGAPRSPFDSLIQRLVSLKKFDKTQKASAIVVSIDIPSGWHVEEGDITGDGIKPDMLVFCFPWKYDLFPSTLDHSLYKCDLFFPLMLYSRLGGPTNCRSL
mgnify:CR=1 FL=1